MCVLFSRLYAVFWPVGLLPLQPPWRSLQDEEHGAPGRKRLRRGLQTMSRYCMTMHAHMAPVFFCIFSLFSLSGATLNVMSGFLPSTNMAPVWIKTHWPFVSWIIKPKKTNSLLRFQFQLGLCEWMGRIVTDPNRRVMRWSSRAVYFTGGCLHSSKPVAFFLF